MFIQSLHASRNKTTRKYSKNHSVIHLLPSSIRSSSAGTKIASHSISTFVFTLSLSVSSFHIHAHTHIYSSLLLCSPQFLFTLSFSLTHTHMHTRVASFLLLLHLLSLLTTMAMCSRRRRISSSTTWTRIDSGTK